MIRTSIYTLIVLSLCISANGAYLSESSICSDFSSESIQFSNIYQSTLEVQPATPDILGGSTEMNFDHTLSLDLFGTLNEFQNAGYQKDFRIDRFCSWNVCDYLYSFASGETVNCAAIVKM